MAEFPNELLARIQDENLNVNRASAQRLREDVGHESQIAQDYRGRLIYALLQNADDAMSSVNSKEATIAFVLDYDDLWVANSGLRTESVHLDYSPPRALLTAADKADQRSLTPSDGPTVIAFLYLSGPFPA